MRYDQRIDRVCETILQNLDEALSLEQLSSVAALSRFHFHRLFSAYTGMSLVRFIQLARLKRASYQLAFKDEVKIIEVALDAGFESPEAFSRAFKRTFEQTPSAFRRKPDWERWQAALQFTVPTGDIQMDVSITDFPETKVAMLTHRGSADRVYDSVSQFIEWRKTTGLSPVKTSRSFGIPHSDPETTEPELFRFDICGSIEHDVPANAYGITTAVIPGGRCAVARHKGSLGNVGSTVYYLYRQWLPDSGEQLRDFPCFFNYLTLIPEVDECDLLTDVYLPLR